MTDEIAVSSRGTMDAVGEDPCEARFITEVETVPSLEELVTAIATELMGVNAATVSEVAQSILRQVVEFFEVDLSFVRRNDDRLRATVLVAEWPPRAEVPDPDPLGVVLFADADPVFAAIETLAEPMLVRPDQIASEYQQRVRQASGIAGVSSVTVPMLRGGMTTGVLGLVRFADRAWTGPEVNALTAIAALMAQTQSRIVAEEKLRYLAYHDRLTGLYNRKALLDHLQTRLSAGQPGPVAVLLLNLDRLKAMNDFLGHAAGDVFLRSVADRVRSEVGATDFVARLGGDELMIVLDAPVAREEAVQTARRIQQTVGAPVRLGTEDVSRYATIGIASGQPGECAASDLLGQADQAVRSGKAAGGNIVTEFTQWMRRDNDSRTDIELHLRRAISDNQLVLHYQPEVDLRTGEVLGTEALVRWNHPVRGLMQPDTFVGIAEQTNLAGELGRWVLRAACAQLQDWQSRFDLPDFGMRVNVSPSQLITSDLARDVTDALRDHGLQARNISLEITEIAVVADVARARETLDHLHQLGVRVAIDDFGTGYSSLVQLKTLSVDTLKIDRGFVTNLDTDPDDLAIVRSIIGLAQSFGLDIVAEGVETTAVADTLTRLGCRRAQGYLFSKPVPATELELILKRGYYPHHQPTLVHSA